MNDKMSAKDKASSLIALHNTQMDHFRQTRDLEFKVNLALWTLLVLAGKFLYGTVLLDDLASYIIFSIVAIVICLAHLFLWMMPIQNSEDTDDYWIRQYRKAVENLTQTQLQKPERKSCCLWRIQEILRKDGWSWIIFEVGITAIILIGIGIVLAKKG